MLCSSCIVTIIVKKMENCKPSTAAVIFIPDNFDHAVRPGAHITFSHKRNCAKLLCVCVMTWLTGSDVTVNLSDLYSSSHHSCVWFKHGWISWDSNLDTSLLLWLQPFSTKIKGHGPDQYIVRRYYWPIIWIPGFIELLRIRVM